MIRQTPNESSLTLPPLVSTHTIIQSLVSALASGDPNEISELFSEEASYVVGGVTFTGPKAIAEYFRNEICRKVQGINVTVGDVIEPATGKAIIEWQGTPIPALDQKHYDKGIWVIELAHSKITSLREYTDRTIREVTTSSEVDFYDLIAPFYELIYGDTWDGINRAQGSRLHQIITDSVAAERPTNEIQVLDSGCGIGGQLIGLAPYGYPLVGSDISKLSRLKAEANLRERKHTAKIIDANMLELSTATEGNKYDVVLSCDNVLRHVTDREQLKTACAQILATLQDGGILIATLRDFSIEKTSMAKDGKSCSFKTYSASRNDKRIDAFFQIGRFIDGFYEFDFFSVNKFGAKATVLSAPLRLLDIPAEEVVQIMKEVGFGDVHVMQKVMEFYNHDVLIAKKCTVIEAKLRTEAVSISPESTSVHQAIK